VEEEGKRKEREREKERKRERERGTANASLCAARQAEAVSRSGRDPDDPPINENQA